MKSLILTIILAASLTACVESKPPETEVYTLYTSDLNKITGRNGLATFDLAKIPGLNGLICREHAEFVQKDFNENRKGKSTTLNGDTVTEWVVWCEKGRFKE